MPLGVNLTRADWDIVRERRVTAPGTVGLVRVRVPLNEIWWVEYVAVQMFASPGGSGVTFQLMIDTPTEDGQVFSGDSIGLAAGDACVLHLIRGAPYAGLFGGTAYRIAPLPPDMVVLGGETLVFWHAETHLGDHAWPFPMTYRRYRIDNIIAGRDA